MASQIQREFGSRNRAPFSRGLRKIAPFFSGFHRAYRPHRLHRAYAQKSLDFPLKIPRSRRGRALPGPQLPDRFPKTRCLSQRLLERNAEPVPQDRPAAPQLFWKKGLPPRPSFRNQGSSGGRTQNRHCASLRIWRRQCHHPNPQAAGNPGAIQSRDPQAPIVHRGGIQSNPVMCQALPPFRTMVNLSWCFLTEFHFD